MNEDERKELEKDILRRRDEWINSHDDDETNDLAAAQARIAALEAAMQQALDSLVDLTEKSYYDYGSSDIWEIVRPMQVTMGIQQVPAPQPAQDVTLSASEIEWLGRQYVPMSSDFRAYAFSQEVKTAPRCVVQLGETKDGMIRFQLVPEKRTDANIAAIEKRRKELLGE